MEASTEKANTEKARAKVNLTLHIGSPIADSADRFYGYHPLDSLVVFADIADELRAVAASSTTLNIVGPFAHEIDNRRRARWVGGRHRANKNEDNLVLKALSKVAEYGDVPTLAITLVKNLPVAAGLGGGSANAAAMLRLLQNHVVLSDNVWSEIALSLGADVPVCLLSKSARMSGIGEGVELVDGLGSWPAVLVNPGVPVSTAAIFKAHTFKHQDARTTLPRAQSSKGDMLARALYGGNDLEDTARAIEPVIGDILALLAQQSGAQIARMSGSGASCFALFERKAQAQAAANIIATARPNWWVRATEFGH